jgi:tRNA G26 N,N-dimethylase Trm1
MKRPDKTIEDADLNVSVQELKLLLSDILEQHANIRMKYQLNSENWNDHYLRILLVTDKGVILNDERNNKITSIKFLSDISRFELDKAHETFSSSCQYKVNP